VDPLPDLFKEMIKRMVKWNVLPASCIPNSCIVNIYDEGDCIPPHIDHHDFVRPFCTVSFLTECNILFGSNLKILSPGEFLGPVSIPLPIGYVSILLFRFHLISKLVLTEFVHNFIK
jgi:alkylated DNA repair protein alkB family protein 5